MIGPFTSSYGERCSTVRSGAANSSTAASIRHPVHVVQAAKLGAHIATMPYKTLEQLLKHPLTDIGLEKFLADWNKQKQLVHT